MAIIVGSLVFTRGQADGVDATLRNSAALTLAYGVSDNVLDADIANEIEIAIAFTKGASSGMTFIVQTSDDLVRWWAATIVDLSTNKMRVGEIDVDVNTVDAAIDQAGWIFRTSQRRRYVRVWAKARGAVGGTLLEVLARPAFTP